MPLFCLFLYFLAQIQVMEFKFLFLKSYFKLNKEVISRETRRSNFIYLPAVRTETAKKSFYYNGSVVYNNYLVNKN